MSGLGHKRPFVPILAEGPLSGAKQTFGGAEEDRTPDLRIANATLPAELRPHTKQVAYTRIATQNHAKVAPIISALL